jgi:hypothetical protein
MTDSGNSTVIITGSSGFIGAAAVPPRIAITWWVRLS